MQHVTIFHLPNCQPCRLTMRMLDKLGAPYVSRPLGDGSPGAEQALRNAKALGMTSAPIVEVRDEYGALTRTISGYNPKALREIAEAAR